MKFVSVQYHRSLAEIGGVGKVTILMEKVLEEGNAAIEVDVDLFTDLLLSLNRSHHLGLRNFD